MKNQTLLPIGSVVYLSEGIVPLMIVARQPIIRINNEECYLDYAAVNQVTGLINLEEFAYFNAEDISSVIYEGYKGENEDRILTALCEWREENKHIPKGKVSEGEQQ